MVKLESKVCDLSFRKTFSRNSFIRTEQQGRDPFTRKEISYINCWALPAGELKHGTLSLIESKTPVIVISTNKSVHEKVMNSALEAKSRGAKLYLISYKPPQICELENFEFCLSLPKAPQPLLCILAILPMQLLSYNVSLIKGYDPDKPRNLAKSVTVE